MTKLVGSYELVDKVKVANMGGVIKLNRPMELVKVVKASEVDWVNIPF